MLQMRLSDNNLSTVPGQISSMADKKVITLHSHIQKEVYLVAGPSRFLFQLNFS